MKTLNNRLHAAVVALAYILVGLHAYVLPRNYTTDTASRPEPWLLDIGTILALVATIAGFIMLARRKSESILLAVSTIAAFLLFVRASSTCL